MNRRRILIVTTSYLPLIGGSELAIREITRRLPEFDFDLITGMPDLSLPRYEKIDNVSVYRVGSGIHRQRLLLPKALLPFIILKKIISLSRRHQYSLMHAFQASAAAGGVWLAKLFIPNVPFVLTLQEGEPLEQQSSLVQFFRKLIINKADYLTAISDYLADYVKRIRGAGNIRVIPNGVDILSFEQAHQSRERVREKLEIKPGQTVVMTVSRLVTKNGVENLIRAFARIETGSVLVIVGEGPLNTDLRNLADRLGLHDNVRWVGRVSPEEVPKYLSAADIFVRPSLSEGLGNAFLEALAAGVPIVAPMVGGIPDFLRDGENGLVCNPKDPADIADKIKILATNSEMRLKLGSNGHRMVVEKYNWNHVARSVAEVYNHIAP